MMRRALQSPLVWVIVLAAGLRLVNLGSEPLWYDEAFTAWIVKLPQSALIPAIAGDVHPPAFYILERLIAGALGTSEAALRLPGALMSVACVWLIYHIGKSAGLQRRTALMAALLAAIFPAALYYAQDARMYDLLTLSVLGMVWAALDWPNRWHWFIPAAILSIYTQNLGWIYVGVILAGLCWLQLRFPRRRLQGIVQVAWVIIPIGAAYLPWLSTMLDQARNVAQGFWVQPLTVSGALWPVANMTIGWRIGDAFQLHVYTVALAATGIGAFVAWRWLTTYRGSIILIATFGPALLMAGISSVWRSIYLPRILLPSAYLLMLIWAYPLMHLLPGNRRMARLIVFSALGMGLIAHYAPATGGRDAYDALTLVRDNFQPGDVLYHTSIPTAILTGYYAPDLPYELRPYASDLNTTLTEQTKDAFQFHVGAFDTLGEHYRRAWLIVGLNPLSRIDERREVARILSEYPAQVMYDRRNDYVQMSVYLVDLRRLL